jgi:sugar O-acyltransferase (sialic acid O-acetyltransferase NeuD family)
MDGEFRNTGVTQRNGVRADALAQESGNRVNARATLPVAVLPAVLPRVSRIIIVGAGGFGREVLQWVRDVWPEHTPRIAGFLAADRSQLNNQDCHLDIIADPDRYEPAAGDGLLLAIGIPEVRRRVAEVLKSRGAEFLTLIHPTAIVAPTASIGDGSIICPYAIVSDAARVGSCVLLNYHSSLGHDASAGDYAVLSPYAALGGNAHIEADVFMGLHASVGPGKRIGARSKVSANSCALVDAPADSIVYGVPGRLGPLIH